LQHMAVAVLRLTQGAYDLEQRSCRIHEASSHRGLNQGYEKGRMAVPLGWRRRSHQRQTHGGRRCIQSSPST
jgi:hypothetical protein